MNDSWLNFLDDFDDDAFVEMKEAFRELAKNFGPHSEILVRYGGKLEKYIRRLAENEMSGKDFETRARDLTRLTQMRILEKEVKESARAQALLEKATDLILNKLAGAIF